MGVRIVKHLNTPRTTEEEAHLKAAMKTVARHLAGHPWPAFSALELLYTAATTTSAAKWVKGHLAHVGDAVEWSHGEGKRSGIIAEFHSGKIFVRFPKGTGCSIQNHRIKFVEVAP